MTHPGPEFSRLPRSFNRRGQALVEFAVVCLAVYLLLAAMLTFGQWLYSGAGCQQAVDVAAREISRTPLPAAAITSGSPSGGTMTLAYALTGDYTQDPASLKPVRQQVFDDNLLVCRSIRSRRSNGSMAQRASTRSATSPS